MKTFSLAYASCRAENIPAVVAEYRATAAMPDDVEVVIAVDAPNKAALAAAQSVPGARVVTVDNEPYNCVRAWNLAAENTTGKVILMISDDMKPPQYWDQSLRALQPPGWMDGHHVVHVNDGYVQNLCTLPIVTRKRYEHFGYLLYPGYESMFCDTELTDCAHRDGVMIEAMHILFEHIHPDCGKRQRDENDVVHSSSDRWKRGELLYNYRKQRNFPIDAGPRATKREVSAISATPRRYAAYLQVTRDDFCLADIVKRLHSEGVRDFFFCIPDEYWSGRKVSQEEMGQVQAVVEECRSLEGIQLHTKVFNVASYRFEGDIRVATETRVRNDSLAWIRGNGFKHILIVDGDELWQRGMMNRIDETVVAAQPTAITTAMIPVIGLPGYPVHRASDRVVVYIGGSAVFRECRTPQGPQFFLHGVNVIHFTACRRTMEEIIRKHRDSGHYDDPDYDMEGWILNTLPNVNSGSRNLHMYRKFQIWPSARSWTQAEWDELPDSVKPYLAPPVETAQEKPAGFKFGRVPKANPFPPEKQDRLKPTNSRYGVL